MKIIELHKVSEFEIFPNEIQIFSKTLFIFKWKKSCHLLSRVLCLKSIWIHGDQKANMKVWESPFIPSHLTFKSFKFTHYQTINQTISQIYLFIITFQNLEFWDVTNLPPLKGISSSRFGEARKKVRFGGLLENPFINTRVWGDPPNPKLFWLASRTRFI